MVEVIRSIKDEKIVLARAVNTHKGRQEHQRILLEGEVIVDWAIEKGLDIEYLLVSDRMASTVVEKYKPHHIQVLGVSEGILKKATDMNYVIPVVGVAKMPLVKGDINPPFVVVLDAIQDFGNIGTIIRTCQAFGVRKILSASPDFDIYHRKTIEASRGSVFGIQLDCFPDVTATINFLKAQGYQIIATSPRGVELQSLVELKRQPAALVVGNETSGISPEFEKEADFLVQIPMANAIESLNVGVATGISIYELKLKQVLTMIEEQIKSTLGRELNVAGMLVQQALDAELRKVTELSSRHVIFMMVLKCDHIMTLTDMCKQFGVLEREADEFLQPMLHAGLVTMDDALAITDKGEEVLAKLWSIVENTESKILVDYSGAESRLLLKQLHQIQEKCVQIMRGG
jgi:RNA methyltransferase, TrmH family